jgi:hypothetical protein
MAKGVMAYEGWYRCARRATTAALLLGYVSEDSAAVAPPT